MTEAVSVYIIACDDCVKIGISKAPEQRVRDIQVGSAGKAHLVAHRQFPSRKLAHRIEHILHWRFRRHHERGEWFRVPVKEARRALASARIPPPNVTDLLTEDRAELPGIL